MATYKANHAEFARFMRSDEIGQAVKDEADRLAARLRALAPTLFKKNTGTYVSNIKVETGLDVKKRDRSAAFVINDSPYATALEVGSWLIKNPPAPMLKALEAYGR